MGGVSGFASRGRRKPAHILHLLISIAFLVLAPLAAHAGVQYVYDELGRISQAINSDGTITEYRYDANGNVVAINRFGASTLSIATFSPTVTQAGALVTIVGSGFSTVPSENAVMIGGVAAVVSSATATQLVVTVPATAVSGSVAVTVGGQTAVSSTPITIRRPAISNFSPGTVNPGAAITLNGINLNLVPGSTSITVGGTPATIVSITNTKIVFSAPSASGRIHVLTSYGEAVSTSSVVVLPASVPTANVVSSGLVTQGGAAANLNINQAGKSAALVFEATAGDFSSVQVTGLTMTPSNSSVSYQVYSPTNTSVYAASLSQSVRTIHLPRAAVSGTYVIVFTALGNTAQFSAALERDVDLSTATGPVSSAVPATAQTKRFVFSASAGDDIGLAVTSFTITPSSASSATLVIKQPDGNFLSNGTVNVSLSTLPGAQVNARNLPATGYYTAIMTPASQATSTFSVTFTRNQVIPLTVGTPQSVSLGLPGQAASLTFSATAGQTLALYLGSIATTPASKIVWATVYNAAGGTVTSRGTSVSSSTLELPNLPAGNYKVQVTSSDAATATMQATLAPGVSVTAPVDGTTASYSTSVPGQLAYFTFSGTAGQDIGIALTGLTISPAPASATVVVYKPDGNSFSQFTVSNSAPNGQMNLRKIPLTGTYKILVTPSGQQTMSFNFTVSQNVTGSLTAGSPINVNLASPGQGATLTFTAAASQTFALNLSSIVTTPSGKTVNVAVLNASGTQVGGTGISGPSMTVNMQNLAAGTYSAYVTSSEAATATMQATLASGVTGALPVDGSSSPYTTAVPGQNAYFTFTGTAGQDVGIAVTNFSITPSSAYSASISIQKPDGNFFNPMSVSVASSPGAQMNLRNLPATGTYKVTVTPSAQATMSFTLTLSQNQTGSLSAGTPLPVNITTPGQAVSLGFAATANQTMALYLGSVTSTPAGKTVWLTVYNAAGTAVGSTGNSGTSMTLNLPNLAAGNYTAVIVGSDAATSTMQATLANGVSAALLADGSTNSYSSSVPGQVAYFTFSGVAGQDLGLAFTSFGITPASAYQASVSIVKPDQNWLASFNVSVATLPGAQIHLRNLPSTGTYKVTVTPNGQATMSFGVTLSQNLTGTLGIATPTSVSVPIPGQAVALALTNPASQTVSLNVSNHTSTPAGKYVSVTVYNASGTQVGGTTIASSSFSVNLPNLAAGTYTVLIKSSDAATATATIQAVVP